MYFISRKYKEALDDMVRRQKNLPDEDRPEYKKGDFLALFLAVTITILPFLIMFIGAIYLAYWLFIGRFT